MPNIPARLTELDSARETVVVCHHGIRSAQVAMYLARIGFERVLNLSGGIDAWSQTADPAPPAIDNLEPSFETSIKLEGSGKTPKK